MGGSKSKFSALTEDILEEYTILTYLSKAEILHLYKMFGQMDAQGILQDVNFRFPCEAIEEIFTQLRRKPVFLKYIHRYLLVGCKTSTDEDCKAVETRLGREQDGLHRESKALSGYKRYNPFRDRIFKVFSSQEDGKMCFEDILDLCSVMSEKCPDKVKAAWAFKIFDFDSDGYVGEEDLMHVIERLTHSVGYVTEPEQKHIIKILMEEMDIESSGKVSIQEFIHAVGKMSEFPHSFCFRL